MSKPKKFVLIAIGFLALLAIFIAAVLPGLVKGKAVELLSETTGRPVRIEKISLNPLTLTASVQGFALEEKGGGPFLSIGVLRVSVSPASIYRRALVLSEVTIESPSVRIVRTGPDRFNFTEILERQKKKEEKPESAAIFPLVLNGFTLSKGSLELDDRAVAGGRQHTLKNLEVALPWLSTLPDESDREAAPQLSVLVNGAPLTLAGKVKLFRKDPEGSLRVTLQKLSLPELAVYVPQAPPVDLASGRLSLDLDLHYRQPLKEKPELTAKGTARVEGIVLNLAKGQPLLKFSSLEVKAADVSPLAGRFEIDSIALDDPELFVRRDRRGEWMFERLLPPKTAKPEAAAAHRPAAEGPGASPVFSVATLALRNGRIQFQDDLPAGGFKASVEPISVSLKDLDSRPGKTARYDLALQVDREVRLASTGEVILSGPAAKASFQLTGLPLQKGWPYLAGYLTAPVKGLLDIAGEVAFSKGEGLSVGKGRLGLKNLATRYGDGEGVDLVSLQIDDAAFSQKANRLDIGRIALSQGQVSLSREADGRLSVESLLVRKEQNGTPEKAAEARPPKTAPSPAKPDAKPFAYRIKRFDLDRFNIAVTDKTRPENPRFTLKETSLSLAGLSGPEPRPARFRFASIFAQATPIRAAGELTPLPFRYRGDLSVGGLPLRDFDPYLPENLNFQILGGLLDTALTLDLALAEDGPAGSIRGNMGLSAFHTVDGSEQDDLLKWERLQVDAIRCDLKPLQLEIGQVSLNHFYSRIIIREDGTLNLQDLVKKPKPEAAEKPGAGREGQAASSPASLAAAPAPVKTGEAPAAAPPVIRIGTVTILDGTVDFTDKHLPNDFETTFYNLGGRISGLTSEASLTADVDLRGNLENQSPLQITGRINPLRKDLFVDLKITFSDIDLSPMSPYSETYLGYILEQGKLFMDLSYHIENGELASENRIRVDQFTFGEEVKSEKATSLPVKLGIALLKDRRGEIHLDVPVTGRIDDPQFNIWRIVFQVLKNLLVKAITAPFSLLSSLFGEGKDLSVVAFAPGSDRLDPPEEKKLEALAKALKERPELKMSLTAYLDREKDAEAYRNELLTRKLKKEKFLALARARQVKEGDRAESVTLTPEERSTYLKAVYAKETFPKPRNILGLVRTLPDPEMEKLILAHTTIGDEQFQDLARERAAAVTAYLVEKGQVPPGRIFQKKDDFFKRPEKNEIPQSRVELNAIVP
ncbi:MAG: DUF748 domain-containing protein [Deltaproteobacteria bacterium]|nr:DUF748 domain-containing protein [Deltaproteobacteria bacterium]